MIDFLISLLGAAFKTIAAGGPDAERQALLDMQRQISDEIARRQYAP